MRGHVHILTMFMGGFLFIQLVSAGVSSYIYPVGGGTTDDGRSVIYFIHQSVPGVISLLEWDAVSKEVVSMLPTACTPADFKMLTDGSGFSFIDQGLIRIKKFAKRSPKTIELYEPIYGITHIEWIDAATFYVSAQERQRFGIFQISTQGTVERLLTNRQADLRYPQKIGDTLFFIEQWNNVNRFMSINCPVINSLDVAVSVVHDVEERVQLVQKHQKAMSPRFDVEQAEILFEFDTQPVVFLCMKSATEGFCIMYSQMNMDDLVLPCTYIKLSCLLNNDASCDSGKKKWAASPLFVFNIPLELLQSGSTHRLYESIVPLLPRHLGDNIYFVSYEQAQKGSRPTLDIFSFDQETGTINKKTSAAPGQYFFAPFFAHGYIWYGSSINYQNTTFTEIDLPRL